MFYFMNRIDWQWRRCKVLTRIFSTWGYDIAWTTFNPSVCRRLEVRYSSLVLIFMLHHLAWWNIRPVLALLYICVVQDTCFYHKKNIKTLE